MYEVSLLKTIDYGATGDDEILQNVRFIMSTVKGTSVLDRIFGLSHDSLDEPTEISKAIYTSELIEAIELNEPRVQVEEVRFEEDPLTGKLIPFVKVVKIDANS